LDLYIKRRAANIGEDKICREVECLLNPFNPNVSILEVTHCSIDCNQKYAIEGRVYGEK